MAHQLAKECYPPTDSDDESFVVLKSDSDSDEHGEEAVAQQLRAQILPSEGIAETLEEVNESLMSAMTLQSLPAMPKMHESMISSCSNVSSTIAYELQEKINELKGENSLLRSTLAQQNIVSRQHSDILTKWKEDVERVHEQHKQKFAKMKIYIEQLKKENKQLKQMLNSEALSASTESKLSLLDSIETPQLLLQQLKDLQDKHATDMQEKAKELLEIQNLLDAANGKCNDSWIDLQQAKDELEKLKLKEDEQRQLAQMSADKDEAHKQAIDKLEEDKAALEKHIQELKDRHAEEIASMKQSFEMELSVLKQQVAGNANQAQIELEQVLQKTKDELERMTEQLSRGAEVNEQQALRINDLKVKLADLSKVHALKCQDYDCLKDSYSDARTSIETSGKQLVDLQGELHAAQSDVITLRASVEGKEFLAEQLNDYKRQVKANDEEYRRMEMENQNALKKEQQLLADNTVLKCQLMKMQSGESAEVQRLRIQLSELQNNILEVKEAKKAVEKEATENRNAVDEITKKYNEAKCDKDELLALGEQLKIYQNDYKSERSSKQTAIDELNKMSNDLQSVILRNQQLCEENEKLRLTHEFVHVPSQQQSPSTASKNYPYQCPRCMFSFRNYRALENHVHRCMELESLP